MSECELDIALRVARGALPSPTAWENSAYVNLRISGTGVAYRPSAGQNGELVYRDPADWCSALFLRRCIGLIVTVSHPYSGIMSSAFFAGHAVGVIVHTWVDQKEDAPWGTARIVDANCAQLIADGVFDTSPGVLTNANECSETEVDGLRLVCEGPCRLLDHLALVDTRDGNKGVWTRSGDAPGAQADSEK